MQGAKSQNNTIFQIKKANKDYVLVSNLKLIPDLTEKSFDYSDDKKLFTIQGVRDIIYTENII